MAKTYTEDQLKAALVRALPEKLEIENYGGGDVAYCWRHGHESRVRKGELRLQITDREWPAIVGMVENGLRSLKQGEGFQLDLASAYNQRLQQIADECECYVWELSEMQCAAALADIGAITVEEFKGAT